MFGGAPVGFSEGSSNAVPGRTLDAILGKAMENCLGETIETISRDV